MSIEFKGLEDVLERIENLADTSNVEAAIKDACLLVERAAKQNAKKGKTGDLRKSITSKVEGLTGEVYTPLEYAPYVEYGTGLFAENGGRTDVPWSYKDEEGNWHSTSGMQPQPFMRPALNENRERILALIKEGLVND